MDTRGTIKSHDQFFDSSTYKHLAYNYSQSETGIRHPDGPVGIMARDQGQLDAYAGRSRSIWTVEGLVVNLAKCWAVVSDTLIFKTPHIQDMKVNGRVLNTQVYGGQQLLGLVADKTLGDNVGFVSKDLQINTETGRIVSGFIPLTDYVEPRKVFEQDLGADIFPSKEERRYMLWSKALNGVS